MPEINLNNNQYENLIKLIFLGNWIINFTREPQGRLKEFDELEQFIYSFAQESGLGRWFKKDAGSGQILPTEPFVTEVKVNGFIEDYNDEIFWDQLIHRLATRDAINKFGEGALSKLKFEEFHQKILPFTQKYSDEFEKKGLDNIKIKK